MNVNNDGQYNEFIFLPISKTYLYFICSCAKYKNIFDNPHIHVSRVNKLELLEVSLESKGFDNEAIKAFYSPMVV